MENVCRVRGGAGSALASEACLARHGEVSAAGPASAQSRREAAVDWGVCLPFPSPRSPYGAQYFAFQLSVRSSGTANPRPSLQGSLRKSVELGGFSLVWFGECV